jgi:hypothetical protein
MRNEWNTAVKTVECGSWSNVSNVHSFILSEAAFTGDYAECIVGKCYYKVW